jgi:ABC-type Fe3+-citrate transport system substrate-binding protein
VLSSTAPFVQKKIFMIRLLFLSSILLIACGPSKEEQRAHEDSVRQATEKAMTDRFNKILELKDSIKSTETLVETLSNRLIVRRADLETFNDRLARIKGFQLLRTPEERESQIKTQVIEIEKLQNETISIARRIDVENRLLGDLKKKLTALQ